MDPRDRLGYWLKVLQVTCRVYRTSSLGSSTDWLTHLGPAETQLLGLQEHRALARKDESSLFIWAGQFPQRRRTNSSSARWFMLAVSFLRSTWRKRTKVSPLRTSTFIRSCVQYGTSRSLFCCAGCACQTDPFQRESFQTSLENGEMVTVWAQGKGSRGLTAHYEDFQPTVLISAACCAPFPWASLKLCVETTSVPVGFSAYRLRFQLSLYFVKSVTIFLLPKCWHCLLLFSMLLFLSLWI